MWCDVRALHPRLSTVLLSLEIGDFPLVPFAMTLVTLCPLSVAVGPTVDRHMDRHVQVHHVVTNFVDTPK